MIIDAVQGRVTKLGRLGENEARTVRFLVRDVLFEHPDATFTLLNKRPGDPAAYPAANVLLDGIYLYWTLTSGDLAKKGNGVCELVATEGGAICKSVYYDTEIMDALDGSGTPPDPWKSWQQQVTEDANRAEEAVEHYPKIVDGYWYVWDVQTEAWVNTGAKAQGDKGDPGDPGHTPVIAGSKTGKTNTITADGETIATILDGEDGDPGQPGVSPTVAIEDIEGGHRITITDASGDHTADVMDGEKGDPGDPTELIDDTAGDGDTGKTWSADKLYDLNGAITANRAMIADAESSATAAHAHAVKTVFILDNKLLMALSAIAVGDTITTTGATPNAAEVTLAESFPHDVQINGTSVLSNGVANVPLADSTNPGVVIGSAGDGVGVLSNGKLYLYKASSTLVKAGTENYKAIVPGTQHESVFYGLAKAAGDSTQSASSNAVGTYTESAKSAISQMLDAPETVSGTTPSITAKPGVRYVCGECATLTIVAPASGCIDVTFTSGSTATVLTVSSAKTGVSAIKWANGFDPSSLDANTTYEVNILDGEFGVVGSWT